MIFNPVVMFILTGVILKWIERVLVFSGHSDKLKNKDKFRKKFA